ncbi:SDR family NAD(P)-dependent oxidoreductase [Arthrobacter bambusae]|uniref:SDR family NAD(P)-dependent oxidoreductase n=1 Tax=Arthrobacter bambusae TaxID=1338426 RepID=UPI002784F962|nr:SDR family NAD(P)-dependent oxidoreductase [Arthrobacter bambusae]MDQ0029072.1 NAD(P)-dependent dehydrogenase (short-subunit alcohol dehydrogenase family) [Arthrobacter bambusae]MDQ0098526.1 NAD(P)-dependent dehydrogenase (short-subunit alcohol dehydrogenase family) [Arthrobacter bambusae]
MDLLLAGKTAIVTGASKGIGLSVATSLARDGTKVVMVARSRDELERACSQIRSEGGEALAISADTTDEAAISELVATVVNVFGSVDILVNAAAQAADSTKSSGIKDLRDTDLLREIDTKVLGYLRCAQAVVPHMVGSGWGRIINVAGLGARSTGSTFNSIRNVSVAAMTKNLADELGESGINVTAVHPGMTVTERTGDLLERMGAASGEDVSAVKARLDNAISIGRMVTSAEVADVITFLCSPRSVAVTGDSIAVGGGQRGVIHY